MQKRKVFSMEWKSEGVMDNESGELMELMGEVPLKELTDAKLERLVRGWRREAGSWFQRRGEAYWKEWSVHMVITLDDKSDIDLWTNYFSTHYRHVFAFQHQWPKQETAEKSCRSVQQKFVVHFLLVICCSYSCWGYASPISLMKWKQTTCTEHYDTLTTMQINMYMLTGYAFSVTSSCKRSLFFFTLHQWQHHSHCTTVCERQFTWK